MTDVPPAMGHDQIRRCSPAGGLGEHDRAGTRQHPMSAVQRGCRVTGRSYRAAVGPHRAVHIG